MSPRFIGNCKQCKEALVNTLLDWVGQLKAELLMVLVPYYFDYVTLENFLLWHKSIFRTKAVDGTKNICQKL